MQIFAPFQSMRQPAQAVKARPARKAPTSTTPHTASALSPLRHDTVSLRFKGKDDEPPAYKRGLEGVVMDHTRISDVDPQAATLIYRGYNISDLVEKSNFEETSYLLLKGALPTTDELAQFKAELVKERPISPALKSAIQSFPAKAHPMDKLKAAVTLLALQEDPDLLNDNSQAANQTKAIRLMAKLPTIVAAIHRAEQNQTILDPDPELSHAENFLYMLSGHKPDPYIAKVFDKTLIAYADHGFNASTTAARVTASTLSDMYSAVASAIGTLKGPLHGGANEQVMRMLQAVQETPGATAKEKAEAWVMDALSRKQVIMGFGHREYKNGDPRANILLQEAATVGQRLNKPELPELADAVREVMAREMTKKEKQLPPNVDYPIGYLYHMLGLPMRLYTPIFAMARVSGWTSHVTELHENNRLYRPKADYQGAKGLTYTNLTARL